jgi:hypothetical protein
MHLTRDEQNQNTKGQGHLKNHNNMGRSEEEKI